MTDVPIPTSSSNTTLLVIGYCLQLAGFMVAIAELLATRLDVSALIRRATDSLVRRVSDTSKLTEIQLTAVQNMRGTLKAKVIRGPAGRDVESRVARIERQIPDIEKLIDRQAELLEERLSGLARKFAHVLGGE
jgi:hypothetical protein